MAGPSLDAIPRVAFDLAEAFAARGFGIWLVGGWVRDALLGRVESDLDFATDARPEQSLDVLTAWGRGKPWTTGFEFGTVGVEADRHRLEVTTFRQEVYRADSRNPEVTYADKLETDLSRRDLTVNALAIRLPEVQLVDPFGGLSDLAARRIRAPLSPEISFSDDPLRMLRAVRFASTLDFEVDPAIMTAIGAMHERVGIVSRERVRDELSKLMVGGAPSRGLDLAVRSGLAGELLPELPALSLEQDPVHRHKDVLRHTLAVLDNVCAADRESPDLVLRLAAVLHDVGKPKTRQITPEGVSFHHHEVVGAEMAEARLRDLRYPAKVVADVRELVYLHLRLHSYRLGWTDRAVRRYVRDAGPLLPKLNTLIRADCTTRNPARARELARRVDELEDWIRDLAGREELSRMRPTLDGHEIMAHLGVKPGPFVGEAYDFLMEIRMDEGEIPKEEAYRRLDEWYEARQEEGTGGQAPTT